MFVLNVGLRALDDQPGYASNMAAMRKLYGGRQCLWRDSDILQLLEQYPQHDAVIKKFPFQFWLVDFVKYLILFHWGSFCCVRGLG